MQVLGALVVLVLIAGFYTGGARLSVLASVSAAIIFGSLLVLILILLVIPGRKGKMRTVRSMHVPGTTVEELWQLLADRMAFESFEVDRTGYPHRVAAKRPSRHHKEGDSNIIVTHASKALALEGQLCQRVGGVDLQLAMWMDGFVLLDSGEGRHVDLMLHRLLEAELDQEPPPVTPGTSGTALLGLASVVLSLCGCLRPFYWMALRDQWRISYGLGLIVGSHYAGFLAQQALREIRSKPEELTGAGLARLVLVLMVLGMAGGAAWAVPPLQAMIFR
jgi:hypothetical protein